MTFDERIIKSDIEDMIVGRGKSEVKKEGWMPSENDLASVKQVLDNLNSAADIVDSMEPSDLFSLTGLISARIDRMRDESNGYIDLVDYSDILREEFMKFYDARNNLVRIIDSLMYNMESILEPY